MKSLKTLISCMLLICLCLSVLALVGCDDLPIDLGALGGSLGGEQQGSEDVHEHTLTDHAEKAATCTDGGWLAYVTCSTCDYTTYTATEALGHDFAENALQSGDHHSRLCTRCTESVDSAHEWGEAELITEPTCLLDGTLSYACTVCGAKKLESAAALGHDFSGEYIPQVENHLVSCVRCNETVAEDHEWQEKGLLVSEPTCTLSGLISYSCAYCGADTTLVVDPLDGLCIPTIIISGICISFNPSYKKNLNG